jgi:hypothetical protein
METNIFDLESDKKQSLEAWVTDIIKPILSAIGHISEQLEALYQELT